MLTITPCTPNDFPIQDTLFQTAFWGAFKTKQAQKALYFIIQYDMEDRPCIHFPLIVFLRTVSDKVKYAYAPKAPPIIISKDEQGIFLESLALEIKKFLPQDCTFIRFDLPWEQGLSNTTLRTELRELRMNFGTETNKLRKAPDDYLCPDTVIINLLNTPEQLFSNMRQTTRNSIRRAYKSNIVITRYNEEEAVEGIKSPLAEWHAVYKETAIRKNFYFEEYTYFHSLFIMAEQTKSNAEHSKTSNVELCSTKVPMAAPVPPPEFYLYIARKDNIILSGLILAICGHNAYYLYAGSRIEGRELMPNYGLQWESILFARKCGCTSYDMLGISPTANANHPLGGLYLFKTGFGGETKHFLGTWDYQYES